MKSSERKLLVYKIVLGLIISIIFFSIKPIFSFDGAWYVGYLDFLDGTKPFSQWPAIRGFVFPTILYLGWNIQHGWIGFAVVLYIFYILTYFMITKMIDYVRKRVLKSTKYIWVDYILATILILLNPIIWGYYHFVLTESVSITLLVFTISYLMYSFEKRIQNRFSLKNKIFYIIVLSFDLLIAWFLKQSYFGIVLFLTIAAEVFYLYYNHKMKSLIYSMILFVCMGSSLAVSLNIWGNMTVPSSGKKFTKMICDLRYFKQENSYVDGKQNISIKNDNYEEIDNFTYDFQPNIFNYIEYIVICLKNNPERVVTGWIDNYLTLCDIYSLPPIDPAAIDYAHGIVERNSMMENMFKVGYNGSISMENRNLVVSAISVNGSVDLDYTKETLEGLGGYSDKCEQFKYEYRNNNLVLSVTNRISQVISYVLFSILTVFSPVILIVYVVREVKYRKQEYFLEICLSFFSTMYILLNVFAATIIDRYIVQAYVAMLILLIIFVGKKIGGREKENVICMKKKNVEKVLLLIPAYNEGKNIKRVIDNLQNNYSNFDYLIINDGSKDNTIEICKENRYNYLDLPVNLGLTGAIQAGMKYAVKNNYDAVIQYDGDGQHRAEYIVLMLEEMKKEDLDIVIGSRYLKERKPFTLRMIGSRIISFIIRITTGTKITDPTSGMRMYNRSVLEEFASNINYGPEPDTISYLIKKKKIKVKEVQVEMDERMEGESYLNVFRSIEYMILMCFSIIFIQQFRKEK